MLGNYDVTKGMEFGGSYFHNLQNGNIPKKEKFCDFHLKYF